VAGKTVLVAGSICLDIIPELPAGAAARISPGALVECGRAQLATGGAVSNVGLALKRLGVPVRLAGRVGDDLFGRGLLDLVRAGAGGPECVAGMTPVAGAATSYSLVLSPPDADRSFLHCPGANDEFGSDDVSDALLEECDLLHFGYPPIMRRMYAGGGAECAGLLGRAREAGLTVSLDMARPDPASPAGRVDWTAWLERVLPAVDVFLPSVEEILFMLDRPRHDRLEARPGGIAAALDGELLAGLAGRLVEMGVAVALIKLGEGGLYLRTAPDAARLAAAGTCAPEARKWAGRELCAPCFGVEVAGTTGSGDCTIAGLLAALLRGLSPEEALEFAVAVGACSVEAADATGGVRGWDQTRARIAGGWPRRAAAPGLAGWRRCGSVLAGPDDGGAR
jgi:sugar/nucleoside kinase (ribokinase family)